MRNKRVFSKLTRYLVLSVVVIALAACASRPTIQSDYDHTIDFTQYGTYGFFKPMSIENPNYTSIYGSVFRDAIGKEMESRGYVKSENPDLLINVSGHLKEKTRVTTIANPYFGGYYGAWGGYGYGTSTHVSQYTEGTVNVDLVDREQKRMVWEGVAVGRVKEKASNEETRAGIYEVIQDMFAAYPFRASH